MLQLQMGTAAYICIVKQMVSTLHVVTHMSSTVCKCTSMTASCIMLSAVVSSAGHSAMLNDCQRQSGIGGNLRPEARIEDKNMLM